MSTEELAEKAYAAYCKRLHFILPDGKPCPHWGALRDQEREAWIDAAGSVSETIRIATSPG